MRPAGGGRLALTRWGPVALYGAGIFWLSHQPSLAPPLGLPDWPMHIAEYAGLGALMAHAMARPGVIPRYASVAAGLSACALFAMLDEWHQSFVPGRHASWADVLADITGSAIALTGWVLFDRVSGKHDPPGLIEIKLFGRQGCHLCDDAERILNEARDQGGDSTRRVRITKVDVDTDREIAEAYGDEVPVVTINGRKLFKHRVEPERLARVLASLSRTGRR